MKALVVGASGQDGTYLSNLLLDKGYEVYGLAKDAVRWSRKIEGDVLDIHSLHKAICIAEPDEIYNCAAVLRGTNESPREAFEVNAMGTVNLLEAVRYENPDIRFCQCSSSEMFAPVNVEAQDEQTPIGPRNPYGVSKAAAHMAAVNYREMYDMKISTAILFNHESPLRTDEYITKKITDGVREVLLGRRKKLQLGNLDIRRDWGHARDYVKAMWLMLQNEPDDFVIATGKHHSIAEFAAMAFNMVDLNWQDYVEQDPEYLRRNDVPLLCGNPEKAKRVLGWEPETDIMGIIHEMLYQREAA